MGTSCAAWEIVDQTITILLFRQGKFRRNHHAGEANDPDAGHVSQEATFSSSRIQGALT